MDLVNAHDYNILTEHLLPEINRAKRTCTGKNVVSIEKKLLQQRRCGYFSSHSASPLNSRNISASTTPTPMTNGSRSAQTSSQPSINGDAIEGASNSRKGSYDNAI